MNPEAIKNYLLRIFPFYYINSAYFYIDENFDNLNDYFYNKAYSTYTSKELIPEFFYLSDLYINFNKISFKNQKKNDILLPANLNKFEIIIDFFKELESIKTSQNINYWIDLIFGYMQNTDDIIFEEKNIKNKYRPESYLNKIYNEKIYLECFIEGIVPKQLFFEKFLSRKIQSRKDFPLNTDSLNSNIFSFPNCFLENYMSYCYSIIIENNFGITINVFDERIYAIYLNNINENIIKDEIIYYPIDGEVTYKPIDANLLINYIKLNYQIIDINNNYIFMGGFKRGSIRYIIFKVTRDNTSEKNFIKKISYSDFLNLYNENKLNIIITAIISINYLDKFYLITGDNCGTIKFIKIIKESFKLNYEILKNIYEHSNEIFSIKYNNNLNLWLSAGLDNIINIFTFKKCEKIGTINLMNEKINKLNYVNFIVNPLISIIIIYDNVLISLSLNGEIINKKIIQKDLNFQNPIIIENADFSQNILFLENNQNFVQFDLPFFEEIKNEIKFKNEIEKFNISLNNNLIIGIAKNKINNEKLIFNNNI
jgi:WD40 repeat protein